MLDIGLWKLAGTGMASAMLTGAVAWFSFGNEVVTNVEMKAYVAKEIQHEREIMEPFVQSMQQVSEEFRQFSLEQKTTNSRLDTLIEVMRERIR
jgi:hypothetical protein